MELVQACSGKLQAWDVRHRRRGALAVDAHQREVGVIAPAGHLVAENHRGGRGRRPATQAGQQWLDDPDGYASLGTGDSWIQGDFNMSNTVTGDDYLAIDANLGKGTPDPLAFAELKDAMVEQHVAMFGEEYLAKLADVEANGFEVVPEPGALSLLGLGAVGLLGRRRRRAG